MKRIEKNTPIYTLLHVFLVLSVALALAACGERTTPKIGTRDSINGNGDNHNGPQKPTPNQAHQIFGSTNLLFMGSRESLRVIDIVLNKNKAKSLTKCQKLEDSGDKINVVLRTGCHPNGFGREEILIEKNNENKITKIILNKDIKTRRDIGIEFHNTREGKKRRTQTDTQIIEQIEMTSADGVQFDITASIESTVQNQAVKVTRRDKEDDGKDNDNRRSKANKESARDNQKKNSRRKSRLDNNENENADFSARGMTQSFSAVQFTGKLDLTNIQSPLVILTSSNMNFEMYQGESRELVGQVTSNLKARDEKDKNTKRAFSCGLADGDFIVEQKIDIGEQNTGDVIETPIRIVNGLIMNEITKGKSKARSCNTTINDLHNGLEEMNSAENVRRARDNGRYTRFQKPRVVASNNGE